MQQHLGLMYESLGGSGIYSSFKTMNVLLSAKDSLPPEGGHERPLLPNCMRAFYINLLVTSMLCFACPQATLIMYACSVVKLYIGDSRIHCLYPTPGMQPSSFKSPWLSQQPTTTPMCQSMCARVCLPSPSCLDLF